MKGFKPGMMRKGESYQQLYEGAMDKNGKKRAWGDVKKEEHIISKTGLKQSHLKHYM